MNVKIKNRFKKLLINSLNTAQINFLGTNVDNNFNLHKESGFGDVIPIPRQTAADTLIAYFNSDKGLVKLFTYLLIHEGERFYNSTLIIHAKNDFINLLKRYKWIYDDDLLQFFLDPFYEHEINFLKTVKQIDLRHEVDIKKTIEKVTKASKKLKTENLEWRITLLLYDFESRTGELIRQILQLLLKRQNLQAYTFDIFTCLKELSVNATKANYKILFEKFITKKQGIDTNNNYERFLSLFKKEIEENGNKRLYKLAEKKDKFISITFQSTDDSIEIWVINNSKLSIIEKRQLLKKLKNSNIDSDSMHKNDKLTEGAGLGIQLILNILKDYSKDKKPIKTVFYPDHVKIGFKLDRSNLLENLKKKLED